VEDFSSFGPDVYVVSSNRRKLKTPSGWPLWLYEAWLTIEAGLSLVVDDREGTKEYEIAKRLWPDVSVVRWSETTCEHIEIDGVTYHA